MARKRRKQRWRINPIPVLLVALAVNLILGLSYSPILALNKVRVLGGLPSEHDAIDKAIQNWSDRPLATVNAREIEAAALAFPEIADAHFEHNAFGRGRLSLRLRTVVGRVAGSDLVLAQDGGLFRWPQTNSQADLPANLPKVSAPSSVYRVGLAIQGGTELGGLVVAAKELAKQLPDFDGVLELNQVGVLCLNRLDKGRVVLGGFDQISAKLQRLKSLLVQYPELSTAPYEINLVAPDRAAFSPIPLPHEPNRQSLHPQGKLDPARQPPVLRAGIHAEAGVGD